MTASALLLVGGVGAALGATIKIPEGPGSNLVYAKCQTCHDLQYVADAQGLLPAQWKAVLASMQDYGLKVSDQEKDEILKYLTTYLGPNPPPQDASPAQPASAAADGEAIFNESCATCHGAEGKGQAGYFPPLAGNPDLSKDPAFPVLVVLNGMAGPITVEGQSFNGSMPVFAHLSDAEVAAVVNFIRNAWGNGSKDPQATSVTSDFVAEQRANPLSPSEVHALRERMTR